MSKILEFSELLLAKFCHDITGQITAVDNGLEILKEGDDDIKEKALDLVSSSAKDLITKLKFYRFAYGSSKSDGEADLEEAKELIHAYLQNIKIEFLWDLNGGDINLSHLTNKACKLLINLIIIAGSSLIHGGSIEVKMEKIDQSKILRIIGKGRNIKINNEAELILLKHEQREIKIANVQIHLAAKIASALGSLITAKYSDDELTYSVEFTKLAHLS